MNHQNHNPDTTLEERLYELVLAAYPPEIRREYGSAMRLLFRDMLKDDDIGQAQAWRRVAHDIVDSLLPAYIAIVARGQLPVVAYGLFLGCALAVAIVLTNVVNPSFAYFGLPDDMAMGLSGGILLVYFLTSGLLASQENASVGRGARVGALTAMLGMGMALLTFIAVDTLFLDIVSKQSEKIWGFAHSDYPSMQAYIQASNLRSLIVFPLFAVIGAGCGLVGAAAGKYAGGLGRW